MSMVRMQDSPHNHHLLPSFFSVVLHKFGVLTAPEKYFVAILYLNLRNIILATKSIRDAEAKRPYALVYSAGIVFVAVSFNVNL